MLLLLLVCSMRSYKYSDYKQETALSNNSQNFTELFTIGGSIYEKNQSAEDKDDRTRQYLKEIIQKMKLLYGLIVV